MLKFGNKEFRNLQEQVLKNMRDIANIKSSGIVLDEFGIKVVGQESSVANMPTVEDYKLLNPEWAYGDAYAIGTEAPYTLYILTREDANHESDYWFDIGEFPAPGPQGPEGPQGETGPQGQTGPTGQDGASAGFGIITASATTLEPGSAAQASVISSGPDTSKNFIFTFGIPEGQPGEAGASEWGDIGGDLADQTDLVTALQSKQNTLVSGTNIKTINNESILGSGNIDIQSAVWGNITGTLSNQTDLQTALNDKLDKVTTATAYGQLYAKDINGSQAMLDFSTSAANTIVRRSGGHIYAGTPTDIYSDTDAVPKDYVDNHHDSTKQDAIADLATIRAGAAAGATAVQPAAIANMVTTTGEQTISGDKTFTGKLNKNANGFGLVFPGTTSNIQNKVLATVDQIAEIYRHYITIKAHSNTTVISVDLLTQGSEAMTAAEFAQFVFDELPDTSSNIVATGTVRLSGLDHKYVGAIGRGGTSASISVYPLVSTGGYDTLATLNVSDITSFVDIVDRIGAHGAGSTGSGITRQDVIDALGYVPSHVDANPSSTTGTLTGIGIDGINYEIQGGGGGTITDVEVNGTSVVSGGVANIDLSGYVLTSSLADVATTGSYNDLINKPTIPVVPTNVSAFTNDAGYITSSALSGYATETWVTNQGYSTFSGSYNDLTNKPSIPSKTSDLTNDSGFITSSALSDYVTKAGGTTQNPEIITGVKKFDSTNITFATPVRLEDTLGFASENKYMYFGPNDLDNNYNIVLPNASGTVALTSDLSSYVTKAGGDSQTPEVISGTKSFTGGINVIGSFGITNDDGAFTLYNDTASYGHDIISNPTNDRVITLPDASGTLALTSDITELFEIEIGTGSSSGTLTAEQLARLNSDPKTVIITRTGTLGIRYYKLDILSTIIGTQNLDSYIFTLLEKTSINNIEHCAYLIVAVNKNTGAWASSSLSLASDNYVDAELANLATVATSGSYNDLTNKPARYIHHLTLYNNNNTSQATLKATATVITDSSTAFTISSLADYLYDNGYRTLATGIYEASGSYYESASSNPPVVGIRKYSNTGDLEAIANKGASVSAIAITNLIDIVQQIL